MLVPDKPKTVCNECIHYHTVKITGAECCMATAAKLWDKVQGESGVHPCRIMNDGDCKLYVPIIPPPPPTGA